jgi:hypothetical protein
MKRKALTLTVMLALLVETCFVNSGKPNPFAPIPAPVHPKITILSPENNSLQTSNAITIAFNVSIDFEKGWSYISYVTYMSSWQPEEITVYEWRTNESFNDPKFLSEFSYKLNLTEIPEGKHTLTIIAEGHGGYNEDEGTYIFEDAYNATSISFTIRSLSILSPQNKTYDTSDVPLLFELPESSAKIAYSLDGQETIMVAGNTTLTDIPDGDHNLTFYVMDEGGIKGASETITFTVATFPTTFVSAITVVTTAVVIVTGLLFYFRKRKQ